MTLAIEQLDEAVAAVRRKWNGAAGVGFILGTGLGNLARHISCQTVIPYRDIPHFPRTTALGHRGQLVCGSFFGTPVVAMEGRCHVYEGYGIDEITLGVRMMRTLGAELLVLSNAAGGVNPHFRTGDVMIVEDHINLMFRRLPTGPLHDPSGRRPRRAASPYDVELIDRALTVARSESFVAHRGVYVAVTGPNYETRAEYRFLRRLGGDAVGMSTVPEAIVAAQHGMRVLALSTITNVATPDAPSRVEAQQVVATAQHTEPKLRKIVQSVVSQL